MVKIDVGLIEGYAEMTAEEKIAALENFEIAAKVDTKEIERYKNAASKANSEAAEWKRKHNALLSEDEQRQLEKQQEIENMKAELEGLKQLKVESENKARLIGLGYSEELAEKSAQAITSGDIEKLFEYQKEFQEQLVNKTKSELLKETPTPPGGSGKQPEITPAQFAEMGYSERVQLNADNPELYKTLIGGIN